MLFQENFKIYFLLIKKFKKNIFIKNVLLTVLPAFEISLLQKPKHKGFFASRFNILKFFLFKIDFQIQKFSTETEIILWAVQFNHLDFILPLYTELIKRGHKVVIFTYRVDLAKSIDQNKFDVVCVSEKSTLRPSFETFGIGLRMLKIIFNAKPFDKNSERMFSSSLSHALDYYYFWVGGEQVFKRINQTGKLKYILFGYDLSVPCRAINQLAQMDNIVTGNIQHGAINYNLAPFSNCNQYFFWESLSYNFYKSLNLNSELYLSGSIGSNQHFERNLNEENKVRNLVKDTNSKICLLCFSGPGHNVTEKGHILNLVIIDLEIKNHPEVNFIFKLHPKDKKEYYSAIENLPNAVIVDKSSSVFNLAVNHFIGVSDFIVTGASTVAIEGLIAKKPIISIDINSELGHIDFLKNEMIYYCKSSDTFRNAMDSILRNDSDLTTKMKIIYEYSEVYFANFKNNPLNFVANKIELAINKI